MSKKIINPQNYPHSVDVDDCRKQRDNSTLSWEHTKYAIIVNENVKF